METIQRIRNWFKALMSGRAKNADLSEEIESHLEMRTEMLVKEGLCPEEARREAMKGFGNVEYLKEECRDSWRVRFMENVLRNVRIALRRLSKSLGFTVFCVATLGLTVGATTSIFGLLDAAILRSLPVENPEDLRVLCWQTSRRQGDTSIMGSDRRLESGIHEAAVFPLANFVELQDGLEDIADVFGYLPQGGSIPTGGGPAMIQGLLVSDNFFEAYGARSFLGRTTDTKKRDQSAGLDAMITHRFWERIFGLDTNPIGQTVSWGTRLYTIVGVLPPGFQNPHPGNEADIYALLSQRKERDFLDRYSKRNVFAIYTMARIRAGVTDRLLKTRAAAIFARNFEFDNVGVVFENPDIAIKDGSRGPLIDRETRAKPLWNIFAVAGIALLVACSNLGSFLLLRGDSRRYELATYAALGARRIQLAGSIVWELVILAFLGGSVGLMVAGFGQGPLLEYLDQNASRYNINLGYDFRIAGFSFGVAAIAMLVFGMAPAIKASRLNAADLRQGRTVKSGGGTLGKVFTVLQFSLAVPLAIGATILAKSVHSLSEVETGYDHERTLMTRIGFDRTNYNSEQKEEALNRIQDAIARLPGVISTTVSDRMPLSQSNSNRGFSHPGVDEKITINTQNVGDDYFETMGIRVDGRYFQPTDTGDSQPVAIIDKRAASLLFPEGQALGKTCQFGSDQDYLIIGVCENTTYLSIRGDAEPTVYFSVRDNDRIVKRSFVFARTEGDAGVMRPKIRALVNELDSNISIRGMSTIGDLFERSFHRERTFASLCVIMASIAVLLACIGLFGSIAKQVSQRTGEIGIRMALGASAKVVSNSILKGALKLSLIGCLVGFPVAIFSGSLIEDLLFGITPGDPLNILLVFAFFVAVTLLAAWMPANRATRIHPSVALRAE